MYGKIVVYAAGEPDLLAFVLSSVIALMYERTFQGLSYSRGLVQSMILGSIVSCLLMIAIGAGLTWGTVLARL